MSFKIVQKSGNYRAVEILIVVQKNEKNRISNKKVDKH